MHSVAYTNQREEFSAVISGPFYRLDICNASGDVVSSKWLQEQMNLDNSTQKEDCAPVIHIRRAVTHPKRNAPEIKRPKTYSSIRTIGLSPLAVPHLTGSGAPDAFLFGGDTPLSYTQVRKMCERIRKDTGFSEKVTPIRFRTTVLTDIYSQTKDIKLTQAAAGHTSADMTLKYYVKGREDVARAAAAVSAVYLE